MAQPEVNNNKVFLGIIAGLIASGIGAVIKLDIDFNRVAAVHEERISRIEHNTQRDDSEDSQLKQQWRYLGSLEFWLNRTRADMKPPLGPVDHPALTN